MFKVALCIVFYIWNIIDYNNSVQTLFFQLFKDE
jgi:hypothetical protein